MGGVRAGFLNEKRDEDENKIKRKGHSELGERNEENIPKVSLTHVLLNAGSVPRTGRHRADEETGP